MLFFQETALEQKDWRWATRDKTLIVLACWAAAGARNSIGGGETSRPATALGTTKRQARSSSSRCGRKVEGAAEEVASRLPISWAHVLDVHLTLRWSASPLVHHLAVDFILDNWPSESNFVPHSARLSAGDRPTEPPKDALSPRARVSPCPPSGFWLRPHDTSRRANS